MNYKCPNCGATGPFQRTTEVLLARWHQMDGNGNIIGQEFEEERLVDREGQQLPDEYQAEETKDELLCLGCDYEDHITQFEEGRG